MELGNRLKELRARDSLSQEALAERIYVTRQTIGNWECGRSYPDLQSLKMLSALFNVSIDELVKGDLEVMNSELDRFKFKVCLGVMVACLVINLAIMFPLVDAFGLYGMILPTVLMVAATIACIVYFRIAAKHDVDTLRELTAFLKNEEKPVYEKVPFLKRYRKKLYLVMAVLTVVAAIVGAIAGWFMAPYLMPLP